MREWEYRKLALSPLPRRTDEVDLLCDAGDHGWELVIILPNNVAYLKREIQGPAPGGEVSAADHAVEERAAEVKVKYRDPATGDTWSGRGRMATWLKKKHDVGDDIEKYRV